MAANVKQERVWSWWCNECSEGDGPFDNDAAADRSADEHDDEHHPLEER